MRNGPRPVDLDIIYYGLRKINTETLVIPHARMQERVFVLRPLADIAPFLEHPVLLRTTRQLLSMQTQVDESLKDREVCRLFQPMAAASPAKTFVMGILNMTPDSFSDGGKFNSVDTAVARALEMQRDGCDILDIGGQSTRPHAVEVSEAEELERVIPVIKAIRAQTSMLLSIDTYRAEVACKAVDAGVNLINDISGGTRDPAMLGVMADTGKSVCLMHMRGDSHTMMGMTYYDNGLIPEMIIDMRKLVADAFKAGVYRWNIILDPGIGFAKTSEQNYEIIKKLDELVVAFQGIPILIGPSRKRFIGDTINEPDASKRVFGTAAACVASVAKGAKIVRVHDIKAIKDSILVADECFYKGY